MKTKNIYVSLIGIITIIIISAFCFAQSETREVTTTTASTVVTTPVTTNEAAKVTATAPLAVTTTTTTTTKPQQDTPPAEEIPESENLLIFHWQEETICNSLCEVVANIGVSVMETPNSINIEGGCLIDGYSVNIYGEFSSRETPNIIFSLKPGEYENIFDNGYITITVTE